jgi:NAD+ diphosphatase
MIKWNFCPVCTKPMVPGNEDSVACPEGHFTKYATPVAATLVFVRNDDKYLILKRSHNPQKGWWDLPGGFVNYHESAEQTVIREIAEETGITDLGEPQYIGTYPSPYGDIEIVMTVGFVIDSYNRDVVLSEENSEYKWVTLEEMPELAFEDCRNALRRLVS